MKEPQRIELKKKEAGTLGDFSSYKIIVDRVTGVQYLYILNSANGSVAVTPLIDREGKPLTDPEIQPVSWFGQG